MVFAEVFGRDPLELWLLIGLIVVMLAALGRTAWKRLLRRRSNDMDPFLVFPEDTVRRPITPAPLAGPAWPLPAGDENGAEDRYSFPSDSVANPSPLPEAPRVAPSFTQTEASPRLTPHPATSPATGVRWSGVPSSMPAPVIDEASETIRLPTAADGTVQLLPGMLVMTEGPEVGREFRFPRVGNQAVPELTMGRANAPSYRHIHLPAATVSRMHARIRYEEGTWRIMNLSTTNPLRLNSREIPPMETAPLADGDRILLGEVELTYRDSRL